MGERWFDRISRELEEAKIVILMLSPQSVFRPWINFEAGWSFAQKKMTIPVCFNGLEVGAMPRPYSDLQGVQLEKGYSKLISDCYHHLGRNRFPHIPDEQELVNFLNALKGIDWPFADIPMEPTDIRTLVDN